MKKRNKAKAPSFIGQCLCSIGLHNYEPVFIKSRLVKVPLERCKRCGVGRQFAAGMGASTITPLNMDIIMKSSTFKTTREAPSEKYEQHKRILQTRLNRPVVHKSPINGAKQLVTLLKIKGEYALVKKRNGNTFTVTLNQLEL